jgi:hypothetical protein
MAQITDSVTSLAQDIGETAVNMAQNAAAVAGEFGSSLVDSGLKLLQDAGVVEKPKPKHKRSGFLAVLIIIVGGLVAFKVIKDRKSASSAPTFPEANRLADSTGVAVG